ATAHQFNISKSTVHKDVTQVLRRVNPALYEQVQTILDKNKDERHLRGGEATKKKYLSQNEKNSG
ncbi:MAG: sporulation transcriptional regulator SpoIIID, partial [Clostridia bacterium]|nr:sporulation transcriptional regulator SpoIIID [Clostridia bacterium]